MIESSHSHHRPNWTTLLNRESSRRVEPGPQNSAITALGATRGGSSAQGLIRISCTWRDRTGASVDTVDELPIAGSGAAHGAIAPGGTLLSTSFPFAYFVEPPDLDQANRLARWSQSVTVEFEACSSAPAHHQRLGHGVPLRRVLRTRRPQLVLDEPGRRPHRRPAVPDGAAHRRRSARHIDCGPHVLRGRIAAIRVRVFAFAALGDGTGQLVELRLDERRRRR